MVLFFTEIALLGKASLQLREFEFLEKSCKCRVVRFADREIRDTKVDRGLGVQFDQFPAQQRLVFILDQVVMLFLSW